MAIFGQRVHETDRLALAPESGTCSQNSRHALLMHSRTWSRVRVSKLEPTAQSLPWATEEGQTDGREGPRQASRGEVQVSIEQRGTSQHCTEGCQSGVKWRVPVTMEQGRCQPVPACVRQRLAPPLLHRDWDPPLHSRLASLCAMLTGSPLFNADLHLPA